MKIRRGQLKDAKELFKTINQTKELRSSEKRQTYSLKWIRAVITSKNTDKVLICEENNKIIGFLIAYISKKKGYSYLSDFYVHPNHRRKGIATKLYKEYEKNCKKLKTKRITSLVMTTNKKMQNWCKKHNFKRGNKFYVFEKSL